MPSTSPILPRSKFEKSLGWIILALLLGGCLLVVLPFVSALLWAVVLCHSCWPLHGRLIRLLGGRRTLAAAITSLTIILVVLVPLIIVGSSLGDSIKDLRTATTRWLDAGPPAAPTWLGKIPRVGPKAVQYWQSAAADSARLMETAKKLIKPVSSWFLDVGLAIGRGLIQMSLSILIAFFLFRSGGAAGERVSNALERITGPRGRYLLDLAGKTVRGVVYGILGTALVQAVMAGIGFLIAGVPGAAVLALLTFFLSPVPGGPFLILVPATFWLFNQGSNGLGIFMAVWTLFVTSIDNVIKPWLISQGSDMPFLLIFFGVVGGALVFGFIGVFIGPTLLAVGYRIIAEWDSANSTTSTNPEPSVTAEGDSTRSATSQIS